MARPHLQKVAGGRSHTSSSLKNDEVEVKADLAIWAYKEMLRARLVDEKAIVLYKQNKCHFQISCAGHEAIQVATAHHLKAGQDWFYPYYRDMALCGALGMTNREFLLNCMNKVDDPNSHGRQMPMHYGSKRLNIVNQSSPTGTQFLQAVGMAVAVSKKGDNAILYVSSGEGACAQGDFHEALNWASRDRLPILFVIQNNDYAISVHVSEQLGGKGVYGLTAGYENLHRAEVDGTDLNASLAAVRKAVEHCRSGAGPALIEAHVPRLQSHSISDNHLKYRTAEDIAKEHARCPIKKLREQIEGRGILSVSESKEIEKKLREEINADAEWADKQPDCPPEDALACTLDNNDPALYFPEATATGDSVFLVDAINHALDEELGRNPDTYIFGEDVAHGKGGVFTVTAGLTAKYGVERVFNSQLAESSIAGVAIGMATYGLKPIAEIQFGDYVWTAMMQLRNELAMLSYRSKGDFTCPAVIRIPVGGYIHGGSYHSQNIEATFAHFPGLLIAYPSNATDAKGLLKAAIRSTNPVLFLEHKGLYRQVYAKGPEGDIDTLVPFGKAKVVREGSDLSIITWGAIVYKALAAAEVLAREEGYNVEVIDLRTIVPFDKEAVLNSVRKTGRVLIAHEDTQFMGFGAEISAMIAEEALTDLDAPIKRIGMKYASAVPHSPALEPHVLPQNEDVVKAARAVLEF